MKHSVRTDRTKGPCPGRVLKQSSKPFTVHWFSHPLSHLQIFSPNLNSIALVFILKVISDWNGELEHSIRCWNSSPEQRWMVQAIIHIKTNASILSFLSKQIPYQTNVADVNWYRVILIIILIIGPKNNQLNISDGSEKEKILKRMDW